MMHHSMLSTIVRKPEWPRFAYSLSLAGGNWFELCEKPSDVLVTVLDRDCRLLCLSLSYAYPLGHRCTRPDAFGRPYRQHTSQRR